MKLSKDSTVRGVVFSLLTAIFLLIPVSLILNRISFVSFSDQGFNLAAFEVFSTIPESTPAAIKSFVGEGPSNSTETAKPNEDQHNTTSLEGSTVTPANPSENQLGNEREDVEGKSSETSQVSDEEASISTESSKQLNPDLSGSSTVRIQGPHRSVATKQRAFQPASLPHYNFVKFSAYRLSLNTFFVAGISSYVARAFDKGKIAHTCEWHPADGTIPMVVHSDPGTFVQTEAQMIYVKDDENSGTYSPTIINCTFAEEIGTDGKGGLLILRISTGYNRWARTLPVVALEEQPGDVDIVIHPPEQFPYKYAYCGAPMHGGVRADWILQWAKYHHYLWEGKEHFFFYNLGGLADKDRRLFHEYIDAGHMTITDILDPDLAADYPTWYFHQVLFINDCLYRSRFVAEHVFFFDFDEFLQVPYPNTLPRLLKRYKDAPWISFGNMYANTHNCRNPRRGKSKDLLERMLWRQPVPECRVKVNPDPWLCIGPMGRRKYVVNPRKTYAAGVHWVTIPEEGINLSAQEARILHYRSAPVPTSRLCDIEEQESKILAAGWIRDDTISNIYAKAKNFTVNAPP